MAMLGSGNVFAFSVVMPTAPVEENDVVRIDERAAPCKEDVVLGNDAIEILIELNLLTNFGAMNIYF